MIPKNSISAGPGLRRTAGRNGVVISRYKGPTPAARRAFFPRTLFTSQFDATKVRVSAGAIRNAVPLIGSDPLYAVPPPTLTIAASGVVYLDASVEEDGTVYALEVKTATTVPDDDPDATPAKAYKTLASVTFASGAITAVTPLAWNITEVQLCNGIFLWGGFGGD